MLSRLILCVLICFIDGFNPFSDEDLYTINWAGPADVEMLKSVRLILDLDQLTS